MCVVFSDWLGKYKIGSMTRILLFSHFESNLLEKKILNINMGIRYEINPILGLKSASKKFVSFLRLVGYI